MARHRDVRNMDYADEYEGYDDVYGHSVDDDYYISPSNRQFIYNRENSRDTRTLEHDDDIQEVDEFDELTDVEKARLNSCIDEIKDILGTSMVPRSELINLILKFKFDIELVVSSILEGNHQRERVPAEAATTGFKAKDDTNPIFNVRSKPHDNNETPQLKFNIPKLFDNCGRQNECKNFVIPNIFGSKVGQASGPNGFTKNKFTIPNIFGNTSDNVTENDINHFQFSGLQKTSPIVVKVDDKLSREISNLKLADNLKETKSETTRSIKKSEFDIDLTLALRATVSLPNSSQTKSEPQNIGEKFEIPFIDVDICEQKVNKEKPLVILPCSLNFQCPLNVHILSKKGSKLATVICKKYKHKRENAIRSLISKKNVSCTVKVFMFDTQSPDDFISSHLKREGASKEHSINGSTISTS